MTCNVQVPWPLNSQMWLYVVIFVLANYESLRIPNRIDIEPSVQYPHTQSVEKSYIEPNWSCNFSAYSQSCCCLTYTTAPTSSTGVCPSSRSFLLAVSYWSWCPSSRLFGCRKWVNIKPYYYCKQRQPHGAWLEFYTLWMLCLGQSNVRLWYKLCECC